MPNLNARRNDRSVFSGSNPAAPRCPVTMIRLDFTLLLGRWVIGIAFGIFLFKGLGKTCKSKNGQARDHPPNDRIA